MTVNTDRTEKSYKIEILFQERMIRNLQHWQSIFSLLTGIGVLLIYFFKNKNIWFLGTGIGLFIIGILVILTVGYAIYAGKKNVTRVIKCYENIEKKAG
ncbi:PTS sugar transporter [uncultured Leuconostoc sp.]|uniref:PTS sugar transporter n=1 Tax=uncultured Leuconostoc sp. TaxID=173262 RepID=UPI0025D9B1D9|nr:PTS sugar transporter [uncultured Leuconostoc sp.]